MYSHIYRQNSTSKLFISILLVVSVLTLFFGIFNLIENKSPEYLASIQTLSLSFVTYFKYHIMVIAGAFGITLSIWLNEQK
jgi:hypothetical protein